MKNTHAVMPSSLAKALISAGVKHFDAGGTTTGGVGGFLTPQSGFQATAPTINTQNFNPQISTLNGEGQQLYGQQQNLAQTLLNQSRGNGPDPAQTALARNTATNVGNTAALIAGARGASSNPGLTARLAAESGANIEQNQVGQEATLEAERQLASQQQLESLYGNEAQTNSANLGINQGANASQNSALTTGGLGAAQINAQTAATNASNSGSTLGGIIGGIGSVLSFLNKGGKVQKLAEGGMAHYDTPVNPNITLNVKGSTEGKGIGNALSMLSRGDASEDVMPAANEDAISTGAMDAMAASPAVAPMAGAASGAVDAAAAAVDPFLIPLADGGAIDYRSGGGVPGEAKVDGDSPKNDTVPALLSPGEDVLPRSVTQAPDAPERAKRFVEALRDQKGESKGYGKVIRAKQTLKDRVERLEKLCQGGRA